MVTLSKVNQDTVLKKVTAIITDLEKQIGKNKTKMDQIDEEYRQKAIEKKASLSQETETLTEEVNYWKSTITTRYGLSLDDTVIESLAPAESTPAVPEDLFTQVVSEAAASTEPVEDEISEQELDSKREFEAAGWSNAEESETVEDEGPEFDGAGFTDADNYPPEEVEEDNDEEEEEMEEDDEEENDDDDEYVDDEQDEAEIEDPTDSDWSDDFPEEWKD